MTSKPRFHQESDSQRLESSPVPALVEWVIHGHVVRLTQDGVSLTAIGNRALDQGQVLDLLEVIHSALDATGTGAIPAPRPLDEAEQVADREAAWARRAQKVLADAFIEGSER